MKKIMSSKKKRPRYTQSLLAIQVSTYYCGFGFMVVRHDAISTVKTVLEENDILIPFPIRTLDFNAKGGDKLNSMLKKQDERSPSKGNTNSSTEQSDVKAGDNPEQPAEE